MGYHRIMVARNCGDNPRNLVEDNTRVIGRVLSPRHEIEERIESKMHEIGYRKQNHNHHWVNDTGEEINIFIDTVADHNTDLDAVVWMLPEMIEDLR